MASKGVAPASGQLCWIWYPPRICCNTSAEARNAFGRAAELIACHVLSIQSIPINGAYQTCFDGWEPGKYREPGKYIEIKSTKRVGGKIVLYDFRMKKEEAVAESVDYIIACHNISGERYDIVRAMLKNPLTLLRVPAQVIHAEARKTALHHINTVASEGWSERNGYEREGYRDGYRNLSLKLLLAAGDWSEATIDNPVLELQGSPITLKTFVPKLTSRIQQPTNRIEETS